MRWLLAAVAIGVFLPNCQCNNNAGAPDAPDEYICDPPCSPDLACRYNICVPPPTACTTNADCAGDAYCDVSHKECLPWGGGPGGVSDPECKRDPVPGVFFPGAQCEWTGPAADDYPDHKNVLATPMVATFYTQDEFSTPSIVFTSYNFTDGGAQACQSSEPAHYYGVVRIIDGRTCEPQASIASPTLVASGSLAIGNLGGADERPEIVG